MHNYKELGPTYKKCIRYLLCSYLPQNNYNLRDPKMKVPEFISADDPYKVLNTSSLHSSNFEQVAVEEKAENVFVNVLYSLKNLRKNTA